MIAVVQSADKGRAEGRGSAWAQYRRLLRPRLLPLGRSPGTAGALRVPLVALLGTVALAFWGLLFAAVWRMLLYFRGVQGIGDALGGKLLGLALLTFLMILLLSNVIGALSTFFLSRDLEILVAAPVDPVSFYAARLTETLVSSSWMVLLLCVPIAAAYGVAYGAGPSFYVVSAASLVPFLVIPAVVGAAVTLLLVNVFPARRMRDLLALIGLLGVGGLVGMLRWVRPERLMRPEEFRSLVDFVAVLRTPTSTWLPSEWLADTWMGALTGRLDPLAPALLVSTAAAAFVVGAWLHGKAYRTGFTRAQEGAEPEGRRVKSAFLDGMLRWIPVRRRVLILREVRTFFRDATQWSQLILLGVLVGVYVYNIRVLPLHTGERISFFLVHAVSFLNLGLAGFVVAAVAVRFVFPAISLEGRTLWLLRSSPTDLRAVFFTKFVVGVIPLLCLSVPLVLVTGVIMDVQGPVLALTGLTMLGVTVALTALALGFGALFPNYSCENAAEIPTSVGGMLFMMAALAYLALVVVLEGWPVYRYLAAGLASGADPTPVAGVLLGLTGVVVLTVFATWLPLRLGARRLADRSA